MPDEYPAFNKIAETRDGPLIYNVNDIYIGRSIEVYGEFSYGELDMFDQLLQPGMTVVEMGANIGAHTVHLARLVGPGGAVHAFEPQRMVFQVLCGNIALNSLANVVTHHAAAGSEAGKLWVPNLDFSKENNFGGLGLGAYEKGEQVDVITLDSLNLSGCNFIKADVEGMEESALRGAEATIKKFKPAIYVECDRKEKAPSLIRYIDSLNYDLYAHVIPLFNPNNFRGNRENIFGNTVSKNILGVSRDAASNISGMRRVEIPSG